MAPESNTPGVSKEEALALLRYMADHSDHHADELRETAPALNEKAVAALNEAIDLLLQSAAKIRQAIRETEA